MITVVERNVGEVSRLLRVLVAARDLRVIWSVMVYSATLANVVEDALRTDID